MTFITITSYWQLPSSWTRLACFISFIIAASSRKSFKSIVSSCNWQQQQQQLILQDSHRKQAPVITSNHNYMYLLTYTTTYYLTAGTCEQIYTAYKMQQPTANGTLSVLTATVVLCATQTPSYTSPYWPLPVHTQGTISKHCTKLQYSGFSSLWEKNKTTILKLHSHYLEQFTAYCVVLGPSSKT